MLAIVMTYIFLQKYQIQASLPVQKVKTTIQKVKRCIQKVKTPVQKVKTFDAVTLKQQNRIVVIKP